MTNLGNTKMVHRLRADDKEIVLLGTAHVSRESAEQAAEIIVSEKPDTVCVELCESRYQSIRQKDKWRETNIVEVIKEKKAFLLLSNLIMASFQKRIAAKLDIHPGEEMIRAIETGESVGADIYPADRDIRITLARAWRSMGVWSKIKILFHMLLSFGNIEDIKEEDIEKMKQEDVLETILSEVGKALPEVRRILIDERDAYLAYRIKNAPGRKIVAVVGAGHVPGIKENWGVVEDIRPLEILPPGRRWTAFVKWLLPVCIAALIVTGFFLGGAKAGTDMLMWWFAANGALAGIGALAALAHPLTIFSSIIAAPLTSLNPMIAAGWLAGLVEAFTRKPQVKDFEDLSGDILSMKGFWRNKITKILLVVVFTNVGSSLGTFVALPMMLKAF
ncbi:MAG: TraB/GumN family protein [Desulfobacterales bacterium]